MPHICALSARALRLIALLLAVLIGAGILSTLSPSIARADDTAGISGAPADESGADTRSRLSYQAAPGQHIDDLYVVSNTGTTDQTMMLFATDAFNGDDGSFGLLDTGVTPTDAASWVSFDGGAKSLTIPLAPGASQVVPFALDVPAAASPGDHAAGMVISVQSPAGEIMVDRRVATRMYVRVPGELQPTLTISSISADYHGEVNPFAGTTTITYTVTNSGNVALAASAVVGVNAILGVAAIEPVREELPEILPGNARTITVQIDDMGQWGYLNPYVKLAPYVDAEALDPGPLAEVARDVAIFEIPWWLLIIVLVVAVFFRTRHFRNSRDEKNATAWIAYTEAEALRKSTDSRTDADLVTSGAPAQTNYEVR